LRTGIGVASYIEDNVGLSYGAFPPKVAESIKCSIEEAEVIFNAYHNEMYPDITAYREQYILPTAKAQGYIHLGLGCRIYTSNPEKHIRTINNASIQFWSIISLLAINEIHYRIDKEKLSNKIKVTSTIYDAIYFEVVQDPEVIKWLNDNIVEILTTPIFQNEIIHNEAQIGISTDWSTIDDHELPNNATLDQITQILKEI